LVASEQIGGNVGGVEGASILLVGSKEGFDLAAQGFIGAALARKEGGSLARVMLERRMEEFLDLLPALRFHRASSLRFKCERKEIATNFSNSKAREEAFPAFARFNFV